MLCFVTYKVVNKAAGADAGLMEELFPPPRRSRRQPSVYKGANQAGKRARSLLLTQRLRDLSTYKPNGVTPAECMVVLNPMRYRTFRGF